MSSRSSPRRYLVAVAWPYANGPLHLGHIAGSLLPPDVFARYHRLRGDDALMVSGSDMHGTPIMVAAEKEGIAPEELARRNNASHVDSLERLGIAFDRFTSTATENHAAVVHDVFTHLLESGYVVKRTMTSPYDPKAARFLPDRYVEGTCPHCQDDGARGDQCDNCGRTLDPQELLEPRSKISGAPPEYRETEHYFLRLTAFEDRLKEWVSAQSERANWRANTVNFTQNWLTEGLKDRPITRDLTYGVTIPLADQGVADKRIYVWFEAVIGYLSAAIEWARDTGDPDAWKRYWQDPEARAYYFLGKDNIPFHTIIWPSMIMGYRESKGETFNLPWDVPANEFMNFGGAKLSKSRGNLITVNEVVPHFDRDAVRFYLCANMPDTKDANWTWEDFVAKVNDELVGTLGNYVNRVLSFTTKNFDGAVPDAPAGAIPDDELAAFHAAFLDPVAEDVAAVGDHLDAVDFKRAVRAILQIAQRGNKSVDTVAPWALLKTQDPADRAKCGAYLHHHVRVIKTIGVLLAPFTPDAATKLWRTLGDAARELPDPDAASRPGTTAGDVWPRAILDVPAGAAFGGVGPLFTKLDLAKVLAEYTDVAPTTADAAGKGSSSTAAPKAAAKSAAKAAKESKPAMSDETPIIEYDDFAKLDLRVGVVEQVEDHPNADKLYVLQVDLGTEKRQILAGLRESVPAADLLGKRVVVIANLAPRKIRGLESQGMILAAEDDATVAPLTPAQDVAAGAKVR